MIIEHPQVNTQKLAMLFAQKNPSLAGGSVKSLEDQMARSIGYHKLQEKNHTPQAQQQFLENVILDLRPYIELGKGFSYLAAAALREKLRLEALAVFAPMHNQYAGVEVVSDWSGPQKKFVSLKDFVQFGVALGSLSGRLLEFDIPALEATIDYDRDGLLDYLGMHTLYDRYFLHVEGKRYENIQHFWMRIAMGVALAEPTPALANAKAAEFYHTISQLLYLPSTPTLFNAGTVRSQMSSCFLTTIQDDLSDIYRQYGDNAQLSKYAGGLGNDWSNIRGSGSWIKGTNGLSQGVIPFIKVQDSSTIAVNQGGKRRGAVCAYLETWHLDIEDFLELRKNTGDERRRTHDMNTANWIPDLFLKRVESATTWTLFCPSETPDLHDLYGPAFEKRYTEYEALAQGGKLKNFRQLPAVQLWRKMLTMLFETGHPWMTFKDPCNLRSPQRHVGVVHSSNLCTEITLNTSTTETAVCNLGSLNLKAILQTPNPAKTLAATTQVAMRMLDNVISENFYPIASARLANERHRPVGLGLMGFQDLLYRLRIPYNHPDALVVAHRMQEHIGFHATSASHAIAQERGSYSSFAGSQWSQGKVSQDTLTELGEHVHTPEIPIPTEDVAHQLHTMGFGQALPWKTLRNQVKKGMRNSLCTAIAPTATISNIAGCQQSIEPTYKNLYVKTNLGGDYAVINEYLIQDLEKRGLWSVEMAQKLKEHDGCLRHMDGIPEDLKTLYADAFEVEAEQLIRCAALRQTFIDQAQSLNLYLSTPSGKRLDEIYRFAWHSGLKTTYYLRSSAATKVEKSSMAHGTKQKTKTPAVAAPSCDITGEGICESCQ